MSAPKNAGSAVAFNGRLALLLAMAMFVLVVDTSIMNVSISAVVRDIDAAVSDIQSAIALEALVSAAFMAAGAGGFARGRMRAATATRNGEPTVVLADAWHRLTRRWQRDDGSQTDDPDPSASEGFLLRLGSAVLSVGVATSDIPRTLRTVATALGGTLSTRALAERPDLGKTGA